jgi:hypothetical protein
MRSPDFLSNARVLTGAVPPRLESASAQGVLWQAERSRFLLQVPGVASFYAVAGEEITVQPCAGVGEETLQRYLNLTPLAALLYQRGLLAFHAAAAVPPESVGVRAAGLHAARATIPGAVLLAGDSGTGKSTLLAALLQRGWRLLADDLAAVGLDDQGKPVVWPTSTELALWPDSVEKLGLGGPDAFSEETNVSPDSGHTPEPAAPGDANPDQRRYFDFSAQTAKAAFPLRAIYWLSVHHREELAIEEVQGARRFAVLGPRLYNSHVADALLDREAYFRLATAVTQAVPLRRLQRLEGQWSVPALVQMLETEGR